MLVLVAHDEVDRGDGLDRPDDDGRLLRNRLRKRRRVRLMLLCDIKSTRRRVGRGILPEDRLERGSSVTGSSSTTGSSTVTGSSSTGSVTAGVLGLAGTIGAAATLGETCGTATGGALASTTIVPPAMSPRR